MAEIKITGLNQHSALQLDASDVLPIVDVSGPETKKITVSELDKRYKDPTDDLESQVNINTADITILKAGVIPADNSVSTPKIQNLAVTEPKIANLAVSESKLAASAVTESKLANNAVTEDKIASASVSLSKLKADLLNELTPVGAVMQFAGSSAPTGWLFCNGAEVSRSEYLDLFNAIGTTYGTGDNSTTFNIPDFRAMFPRGASMGATGSIQVNSIDYTPQSLGTRQPDAMQGHQHKYTAPRASYAGMGDGYALTPLFNGTNTTDPVTDGVNGTPRTASENRPINLSINFIIKY